MTASPPHRTGRAADPTAQDARSATPGPVDPDERVRLTDQRAFLLRSLEDLEREHEVGDLDDHDFATLRDDYTARAAAVLRALDEHQAPEGAGRRGRGRRRSIVVLGAVVAFAALAGVLVASSLGARQAGDSATGGISVQQSPSQRAQACISKLAPQAPKDAVTCFQGVLDDDPRNVVAQTWLGWQLELSSSLLDDPAQAAALQTSARNLVEEAVEVDPDYSYARAFRAVIAFRRQDYGLARRYLADFRARNPSPDAESVIIQFDLDAQIDAALDGTAPGPTSTPTTGPASPAPSTTVPR